MRTHRKLALLTLILTLTACEYEGGEGYSGGGDNDDAGGSYTGDDGGSYTSDDGGSSSGGGGSSASCNDANENCGPGTCGGEGGTMLPGANCLSCHTSGGGGDDEAPRFTVAGTVFTDIDGSGKSSGATVFVTDASGQSFSLTSNSAGNFYSTRSVDLPLTVEVEQDGFTMAMGGEASSGACNSCHKCDGEAGGKLYTD